MKRKNKNYGKYQLVCMIFKNKNRILKKNILKKKKTFRKEQSFEFLNAKYTERRKNIIKRKRGKKKGIIKKKKKKIRKRSFENKPPYFERKIDRTIKKIKKIKFLKLKGNEF
ncbi:hypothetical protein IMG5_178120 [Ichthyophthirius multifiliis]|uniref:Uncharacterized protein n=1 Tax=Ichthyophthirius multifiliis TaxID=5932 RepID=G0R2H4_ICHMU|nr:hypothetical protein IMG5_178120 [Ichthyophthirius multifiliis]EGR28342.1 hypothetical protein IMG5_178120 [Ichthyophthirius multifiliis]|eukprot:XP_004027687.1 hypothetical protein IMG5_178120 [Ichthyophthirius multifiliis]